jgi:hypothetical protein
MPLTAEQLLNQRMAKDKQDIETAFQNEVAIVNKRYGAFNRNPNIEAARIRSLAAIRKSYQGRAGKLVQGYEKQTRLWSEFDALAKTGQLGATNLEELKMRSMVTPDMEKVMFPKEEDGADPVSEYGKLNTQLERVQSGLDRFEAEAPSTIKVHRKGVGRLAPWPFASREVESPGGGTLVVEEVYDDKANKGTGGMVKVRRNATREELEEWASLTEHKRLLKKALTGIRESEPMAARLRLAALRSPRQGAFAEKAVGATAPEAVEEPNRDPLGLGL